MGNVVGSDVMKMECRGQQDNLLNCGRKNARDPSGWGRRIPQLYYVSQSGEDYARASQTHSNSLPLSQSCFDPGQKQRRI